MTNTFFIGLCIVITAIIFSLVVIISVTYHENKNKIYKDYRIGKYIFTVHLLKGKNDKDIYIEICDWHLPPRNRKERRKIKVYDYFFWRYDLETESIEDFILKECLFVIKKIEKEKDFYKQWEKLSNNPKII